jgi:hypothetical protein
VRYDLNIEVTEVPDPDALAEEKNLMLEGPSSEESHAKENEETDPA